MSLQNEDQAVADTEVEESKTAATDDGAQEESIDDLVKLFESDAQPKSAPAEKPKLSLEAFNELVEDARESRAVRTEADISGAVDTIYDNLSEGVNISKKALRQMLNGAAGEDAKLRTIWANRKINPEAYNKALRVLAREWSAEFEPVDRSATDTKEAVTAAVRSASKPAASEPEDYSKVGFMSDAEFEAWKRNESRKLKKG